MEWLNRMTAALEYLEQTMDAPLDIAAAARTAYSSPFHFQRMFYVLTGMTVAEYVRKRKLTLAAQELAVGNAKVLDVSLKYGYESPEAFTKAFRKIHGIPPSAAREPGKKLKAFPRLSFQISLKGDEAMDYKIVTKEAFRVVGKSIRVTTRDKENLRLIPKFWEDSMKNGIYEKLCNTSADGNILGICADFSREMEEMTYMIAVEPGEKGTEGMEVRELPAATWAVFQSVGPMPGAIQKVWSRIFSEWFPATGYEHAGGPELEVYLPGCPTDPEYRCEVWVPIVK